MKIDLYISSLSGGGAEKVLVNIANKLADEGNQVTIISLEKRTQFYHPNTTVTVKKINNYGLFVSLKDLYSILKYMKISHADVVISFLSRCNILTLLASLFSNQKIIVSDRNNPIMEHSKYVFWIQNLIYLRANQVIVQTNKIKSYYWKVIQNKITVIENPIDVKALESQLEVIPVRQNSIISMGRLEEQKDFKTLINAFSKIHSKFPNWTVKIYGVGNMQDELKKEVDYFGLSSKVFFCGRTDKPYSKMMESSIFVLSSFYEGFPNVLSEALYAGNLCISSNCISGPSELIEDGKNGWLFEVGDVDGLAKQLEYCISNIDKLEYIRALAKDSVKRLYLDVNIEQWKKIINCVVK